MKKQIAFILSSYYAIYVVLTAFVEPLTWFVSEENLERISFPAHVTFILAPLLGIIVYYYIFYRKKALLEKFLGLQSVSSGKSRVDAFQDLRSRAHSQIIVVGIGLSHIVQYDMPSLEKQAETVSIDFLMIDPDFLEREKEFAHQLERFLDISLFTEKVRASFEKLKASCEDWNNNDKNRHKMSLKVYETIPTNSMVIIDPDEDTGEVIVEFFLYQSGAYRPRLQIKKIDHRDGLFDRIKTEYLKLWNSARRVV